jgi:hypothetical protein
MNNIPVTSQYTPMGIWFIFRDGERVIADHNSLLGKESIFINGKIVSKKRTLNRRSNHSFNFEENTYEIDIFTHNTFKELECHLKKDGIYLDRLKVYDGLKPRYKSSTRFVLIGLSGLLIGFLISLLVNYFKISFSSQLLWA